MDVPYYQILEIKTFAGLGSRIRDMTLGDEPNVELSWIVRSLLCFWPLTTMDVKFLFPMLQHREFGTNSISIKFSVGSMIWP